MRQLNDGKQMTDVWRMPAVAKWEKSCGKHPTQKPLDELKGKVFNKSLLLNTQEQRGAYWIKKYEEVIRAFE